MPNIILEFLSMELQNRNHLIKLVEIHQPVNLSIRRRQKRLLVYNYLCSVVLFQTDGRLIK